MHDMSVFLIILLSLFVGYLFGDFQNSRRLHVWLLGKIKTIFRRNNTYGGRGYYEVLAGLFNEQPDEALDSFVTSMEVTPQTLEVHLALGSMLRRRGEFARALRVRENLVGKRGLSEKQRSAIQLEIARDYWHSGLLDRAEQIFKSLADELTIDQVTRRNATESLVTIYQDIGDWLAATEYADRLTEKKFASEPDYWRCLQAQFCCELAEAALQKDDTSLASTKIRHALHYDSGCVRASLLDAQLSLHLGDKQAARLALDAVPRQNSEQIPEMLPLLLQCFVKDNDLPVLINYLMHLQTLRPSIRILLTVVEKKLVSEGRDLAFDYWRDQLPKMVACYAEVQLLQAMFVDDSRQRFTHDIATVKDYFSRIRAYVCEHCGFSAEKLLWRCPSCHKWACMSVK